MPFEGAGAVSDWKLSLPKNFRQFDYQTITDVILHISYTAEEDGKLRDEVEEVTSIVQGSVRQRLQDEPLIRLFSLRQDFSGAFNSLLHSPAGTQVKIKLEDKIFPVFLKGCAVKVGKAHLLLNTPKGQSVSNVTLTINGSDQTGFALNANFGNLQSKDLGTVLSGGLRGEHTWVVKNAGELTPSSRIAGDVSAMDSEKLIDVMLYLEYKVTSCPNLGWG